MRGFPQRALDAAHQGAWQSSEATGGLVLGCGASLSLLYSD
jgi:hypothetical protein